MANTRLAMAVIPVMGRNHFFAIYSVVGNVTLGMTLGGIADTDTAADWAQSTGDVIEAATRQIVAGLKDEHGTDVQSEKLLEIDFRGNQPCRTGNQFGIGRVERR